MALQTPQKIFLGVGAAAALVFCVAVVAGFSDAFADRDQTAVATIGTAHVEQILGPRVFDGLGGPIGPDFGVTSAGAQPPAVALSVGGVLRVEDSLDALPRTRKITVAASQPSSFALDTDGTMLAVADGYLGVLDQNGVVAHSLPLAFDGMRLAPSTRPGFIYLFGGANDDFRLYRLVADGTLQVVLQSKEPIVAAADNGDDIYAATPTRILRLKAGAPDILFKTPDDFAGPIRSLAVTDDGMVIFSTDAKVYALLGPNALSIVNDAGGFVRVREGALYVLDPARKLLFRLTPASSSLVEPAAA
jgi:hypothetical protein